MSAESGTANTSGVEELPNEVIRLNNVTCAYCGSLLEAQSTSREHVIGRRFVPRGKLNNGWNLILKACEKCNGIKSDLEDDISAISMQADIFGQHGHEDAGAAAAAVQKAGGSYSRRTKKLVKDSQEELTFSVSLGAGANVTFNFVGQPQIDSSRIFQLARLHLMGFFYWMTFDAQNRRGRFWHGGFYPVHEAHRRDWGNPINLAFAEAVAAWQLQFFAEAAEGFFKVIIRKHPSEGCWAWALEWNHGLRVVGFFGEREPAEQIAAELPKPQAEVVSQTDDGLVAARLDTPLDEQADDKLFRAD